MKKIRFDRQKKQYHVTMIIEVHMRHLKLQLLKISFTAIFYGRISILTKNQQS